MLIDSEASCRAAYLNYHCYGNTMNLSAEDMGKITQKWSDKIPSWQATVANDENEYDFDDSDYANYKQEGKEAAEKATGYEKAKGDDIAAVTGHTVASVGGAAAGALLKGTAGIAQKSIVKEGSKFVIKEGAKGTAKEAGKNAMKKSLSWSIAAPLALATAIAYMVKKPNKEEKEACDALQTEMNGAIATLGETQAEMENMSEEIITLSDEANTINEDTNEEIEEQKTEYDMYMATYTTLKEKVDAGEPLTDSEKQLYKSVVGYLSEIGVLIEETADETSEEVNDLYDEIGTYQEGYDTVAESMGEVEGLTDFAESFDESTRTMCYVEAAAQTINVASGTAAGAKLLASLPVIPWKKVIDIALAALSFGAAASSGVAAGQQFKYASEVSNEISLRKETQDINTDTMDIYTEEIDAYDGYLQGIEDLELEIPEDIEAPEDVSLPNDGAEPTGEEAVPEVLKPKKEDEEK